jgi:glycosyltransferase involved in cell wall biosynthesis
MAPAPIISVITPSFNQGPFIRETIASVLAQGGNDWEHIVVDGGSDDDTVPILKEHPHLIWVSEEDEGQADALNKAMSMSSGDLIFWINSDDLVAPGAFEAARQFFANHGEAQIVCGNSVTLDEGGKELIRIGPRVQARKLRYPWDGDTSMHQPSIVFRRAVYEFAGPFDITLNCAMDYDFFLRASGKFQFHHHPVDFGLFREYAGTKTGGGAAEAFKEVRTALVRYVRSAEDGSPAWASIRAYFAQGCVWVNDAVANYLNGHPRAARRLLWRAVLRYPPSLFVKRHLYFRLLQVLGPEKYDRLRGRTSGEAETSVGRP